MSRSDDAMPGRAAATNGMRPDSRALRWLSSLVTAPFLCLTGLAGLIGTLSIRYALIGIPMLVGAVTLLIGPVLLARRHAGEAAEIGAIALHVVTLVAMALVHVFWDVDERDEWLRTVLLWLLIVGAVLAVVRIVFVIRRRRR